MNRKRNAYSKKKSNTALTILLTVTSLLMTAIVVWIGMNGWDVNRALEQAGIETKQERPMDDHEKEADEALSLPEDETPVIENEPTEEDSVEEEPKTDVKDETELPTEKEEKEPAKEPEKKPEKNTVPSKPAPDKGNTGVTNKPAKPNKSGYIEGQQLPGKPTIINGILLANKKNPLPSTYAPGESKQAREAFNEMAAEAKLSGFNLTAFSTYRSYEYQVSLYDRYVKKDGVEAADRYSARPGYSEHQTGLAFDIGEENFQKHWASSSFGETEAGKWVASNAYRYGFIMRYPKGKEDITGYMHESWHFRYVGKEIAEDIFKRNITLEEYLGQ